MTGDKTSLAKTRGHLPNLTRQFDLLRKGCKSMGLESLEDQFSGLQDDAQAGTIKAEDIIEIIDSDYRNERGGREALTQFVEALIKDALAPGNAGAVEALRPHLIDNDLGDITVTLNDKELRGWSYKDDAERRTKMLAAREYIEGWYDGREAR
jgi:hypothetical protein